MDECANLVASYSLYILTLTFSLEIRLQDAVLFECIQCLVTQNDCTACWSPPKHPQTLSIKAADS